MPVGLVNEHPATPDPPDPGDGLEPIEEADAELVLADVRALPTPTAPASAPLPAVQAAAVAATGFVAGAATVAVIRHRQARRMARRRRRAVERLPVVGSRSFLVDVHLLGRE